MSTSEMSWEQATLSILGEVNRPIHYSEIAELILERELKTTIGKTPQFTVAGEISKLRSSGRANIVKVEPGVYQLIREPGQAAPDVPDEVALELDAVDIHENLAVAAYGLHWERDKVDWSAGRILGYDIYPDPEYAIDFAGQQGVYLLYNWQSVVYVGKTAARERGLFQRLYDHHRRRVWSGKWERFSWFGLRRVNEDGQLVDVSDRASPAVVTALMEAVLIEALGPSFNVQGGSYMGTLYRQATDPNLARAG